MNVLASSPPRPLPTKQPPGLRALLGAVAVVAVLTAVVALWWPRSSVVAVHRQPADVVYADGHSHVAVLRHVRAPIAALRLADDASVAEDHYVLVLGSDPAGAYGHMVRLDAGTATDAERLTVVWTPEGAEITYGSGHRLFVPAALFTGGR
ncbi:hypothetical protein [Cryptosporangium aurantiacum]|uniref:hypothetical protein n=1 Tax=Cryptosporangium aurantiacum TaxID=134849 RepID=UPI001C4A505C|nr:hypothetical protein [Cryptosporangium aurantiacum]